jgi:hypothetical protein
LFLNLSVPWMWQLVVCVCVCVWHDCYPEIWFWTLFTMTLFCNRHCSWFPQNLRLSKISKCTKSFLTLHSPIFHFTCIWGNGKLMHMFQKSSYLSKCTSFCFLGSKFFSKLLSNQPRNMFSYNPIYRYCAYTKNYRFALLSPKLLLCIYIVATCSQYLVFHYCSKIRSAGSDYFKVHVNSSSWFSVCELDLIRLLEPFFLC